MNKIYTIDEIKEKLSQLDYANNLAAIRCYLNQPEEFDLVFEPDFQVVKRARNVNPGICYLNEIIFSKQYNFECFDLKEENDQTLMRLRLNRDILEKKSLFVYGANGIGKTTFTIACCNHAYGRNNDKFLYVSWPDFIEKIKNFDNKNMLDRVKLAKCLVIDDLGAENITRYSRDEILFSVINYRLERQLQTIIISNCEPDELHRRYLLQAGESKITTTLVSKITGLCVPFKMVGKNYRNGE